MGLGLTTVKLFPAEVVGGVKMLKALYGPYRGVKFMPTGGISPSNVKDYLSQPNVIACAAAGSARRGHPGGQLGGPSPSGPRSAWLWCGKRGADPRVRIQF